MLDFLLIASLGFFGSFGHCMGMCSPLTVAFSLSQKRQENPNWYHNLGFHLLLNIGRIISYALVGMVLGGVGSVLIASGQLAGIGSVSRQFVAIFAGLTLIWLGLLQINPDLFPRIPKVFSLPGNIHQRLSTAMTKLSYQSSWWMPLIIGGFWGLIPCGFLYIAQIKAAETSNPWLGAMTMLVFGLGTTPMMVGVGISASKLSADKRSQLFRLGGPITVAIGMLTLLRTSDMVDFTGHLSLLLLMLALIARPCSKFWLAPLQYRRAIGVIAFLLAIAHTAHMLEHSLNWNLEVIPFMLPQHRWGIMCGVLALLLITPAALTSFDSLQKSLGHYWRRIHLLTLPGFILGTIHTLIIGSHYLGELGWGWQHQLRVICLLGLAMGVILMRSRYFWRLFSLGRFYTFPPRNGNK